MNGGVPVTVVAPNATTADAVATIVSVMAPGQGLNFVGALNSPDRARHPSESFNEVAGGPIECWVLDAHDGLRQAEP